MCLRESLSFLVKHSQLRKRAEYTKEFKIAMGKENTISRLKLEHNTEDQCTFQI